LLNDTYGLTQLYTGYITLNQRPEWVTGQTPFSSVTVLIGGPTKCVEYGSIFSFDPDLDNYSVQIHYPSPGLPQGLILNIDNSTNITVKAQSGFSIAGNYAVGIFLIDARGAVSLT
jgi:hypothetical protein